MATASGGATGGGHGDGYAAGQMDTSGRALAAFIRSHPEEILVTWERLAAELPGNRGLPTAVLRDSLALILEAVAAQVGSEPGAAERAPRGALAVVAEHALDRADIGAKLATVTRELFALRDAIEAAWPESSSPEARGALAALHGAVERIVLASIERYSDLRTAVLDAVDAIVRRCAPGGTVEQTLTGMLQVLLERIEGIDTVAILLREEADRLRVRAAVGPESAAVGFTLAVGEGFAGVIAAERKPRLLQDAAHHPLIVNPVLRDAGIGALYGVPLLLDHELVGVAHMGSFSANDFSEETKGLFRVIMERVVRVIQEHVLREHLVLEQARYQAIVDNAPTIIFSKDAEGRYLTINRRALEELGLSPDAVVGKTDEDIFPSAIADAFRATDRRVWESKAAVQEEDEVPQRGAPRFFLTVKYPILDAKGRVTAVGGVATNITEARRAQLGQELLAAAGGVLVSSVKPEEKLTRLASCLVRSFSECCVIELVDEQGAIRSAYVDHRDPGRVQIARALVEMPVDRTQPYLGDTVLQLREPVCMPDVSSRYLETLAQGDEYRLALRSLAPASMIHVPLVARDCLLGAMIFLRTRASCRYDELDLRVASELADRTALEIDAARLQEGLRCAIRSRDEILGVVAHDLRSPISAVALAAQGLRRQLESGAADGERQRRGLDSIVRSTQRMHKLVSDLLDQYALDSGRIALATQPYPARALVGEANEALASTVQDAGIALEVTASADLPLVRADRDRVQQVFGNLVGNAVKFTPAGGRITLGARLEEGEVEFFVSDTGPGFEAEVARHLFERPGGGPADKRGVGLGLAISRGIVEAHGGRIWATGEPGRGATVCFTLPAARPADEAYAASTHVH